MTTLSQVFGTNVRRLRQEHGLTLDEVATAASKYGLKWNTGTVSDIESGRRSGTRLATFILMARVFADLTDKPVALAELLTADQDITLNDGASISPADLISCFTGCAPHVQTDMAVGKASEAEVRAAKSIGITVDDLKRRSEMLWGQSYVAERDARSPIGASPQTIGRVSRRLIDELGRATPGVTPEGPSLPDRA